MVNKKAEKSVTLAKRLYREYMRPHIGKFMLAVGCMVIVAASTALNAWLMQPALDDIFLKKDVTMLALIPLVVLGIAVIKGVATFGQDVVMKTVGQKMVTAMQMDLYKHLLDADIRHYTKMASGKLLSQFSNDIFLIRKNVTRVIAGVFKESITLVFLIGVMFYQSVTLSLIAFFAFPLAIYPIVRLGKRMRKVSRKTQEALEHFVSRLDDSFQGIRMVKAFTGEKHEYDRAKEKADEILGLYIKGARTESASSPIMETLSGLAIAAVIWYGGYQVIEGHTTPGSFFSFITALLMAYRPVKALSRINNAMQEGMAAMVRVFAVMDAVPEVRDKPGAKVLEVSEAEIAFDGVSFGYEAESRALEGLSFTIPAGKKAALVGASGAGKSTVMHLLLRFYDPQEGTITLNGEDVRDVTLQSLREHMALVNQEATLFDDTIRNNIAYANPEASEAEVIAAAKRASAHDFIEQLPEGYDTPIGQHGVKLSGGQRQRLAIARAMLKDAPILLLDEATSALDAVSESHIREALRSLLKGRTSLIIAHRLSTIQDADIIFVLDEGRLAEQGTHDELLAEGGVYKRLYDTQFHDKALPG